MQLKIDTSFGNLKSLQFCCAS